MRSQFNWSNFDLEFLNSILRSEKTPATKRPTFIAEESYELAPFMEDITSDPSRQFIIDYRNEIDFHLLKRNPELVVSVFGKSSHDNPYSLLREITAKKMGEMLASRYIVALNRIGCNDPDWDGSEYTRPVVIDLRSSGSIQPQLYDFQEAAVERLNEFTSSSVHKSGILVMPTGSGKTRTAVFFLLRDMVSQGYQVIWLAHRHMLIDQAAEQFKNMSPLISEKNPAAKELRFMCASGKHGTIKATSKKQDVMILSVQTAVRNLAYLQKSLKNKVIIVVDEAHHTVAPSYQRIVNEIRKRRPDSLLLGLTATPVRLTDYATDELYRMFEGNFIYQIGMSELIKRGVLAEPNFTRVETGVDFEPQITVDEGKYIDQNGELPSTLIQKIALSKQRNEVILKQYLNHTYGKTLIFALNIIHAQMLSDELKKHKVKCGCVYSGQENNDYIIRSFSEGKIDVLINVNILTEGSDVPSIETVFLTRPTQSEGLLMQMIGRGMRGKLAGGTEKVEIVDFIDQWDVFACWLDPKFAVAGVRSVYTKDVGDQAPCEKVQIPWSMIRAIYREMGSVEGHILESQTIPVGWFSLEDEGEPYTLLVFSNQLAGYLKMLRFKKESPSVLNLKTDELLCRFFSDMGAKPDVHSVKIFWENLKNSDLTPHLFQFTNRRIVDPYSVAERLKKTGEDLFGSTEDIFRNHEDLIRELFGSLEEYRDRIFKILNYNAIADTVKIEELPIELVPFKLDKPYDLSELYAEVQEEMREYLGSCIEETGKVEWTMKPFMSFFGRYFGASGNIEINCILNSSDVPREVVKYVLYHEMLHRKHWFHDKAFRTIEHKYPNYTELEKFLDSDFGDFRFEY